MSTLGIAPYDEVAEPVASKPVGVKQIAAGVFIGITAAEFVGAVAYAIVQYMLTH
jgi:hypothetical protein